MSDINIIYRTPRFRLFQRSPYAQPQYEQLCFVECEGIKDYMWLPAEEIYL